MRIYIWGCSDHGRLGLGCTRDRLEPTLFDTNNDKRLEWIQIECGDNHTIARTKNGEVFTWGDCNFGKLGHGDEVLRTIPTKVASLAGLVITQISCGVNHTAALTDKGGLLTWGSGWDGRLGHGNEESQFTPKKVEALADEVIVEVACGTCHTCALTSTGSIHTWGYGFAAGHDEKYVYLPRLLQDLSSKGVVSVSAASYHTACVTKAGEVFTWGCGDDGSLGHGDTSHQYSPKRVEALVVGVKAKQVSCGYDHTAVCTEDGRMYTFGQGKHGQLGHGDKENRTSPTLVQALESKHITQVQCGWYHTMVLTSSGYVFTWGNGKGGHLGHGSNSELQTFTKPCLVEGLREHNVVQISSGYGYCGHCAVLVDPTSPSNFRQSQPATFNNKQHFDVVFMVENEPLYANVDVLSQKSDYFAAMFRSNMKENMERVVQVPHCSKAAFLLVLKYVCLDDFIVSIDHAVELWDLADMYQLEELKYSCMSAFYRILCEENVSQILDEAEDLGSSCNWLRKICHEYFEHHYLIPTELNTLLFCPNINEINDESQ